MLTRPPEPNGYEMWGPEPTLADFPREEWSRRIAAVQKHMVDADIELLVLWSEHNIRYFSGFTSTHWSLLSLQPQVVLIPANGQPIAITSEFLRTTTEAQSWIRDIRCRAEVNEHSEAVLREFPVDVAHEIRDLGFARARIGLEMGDIGYMHIPRPLNDILAFMHALPGAEFVAGDATIWKCRQIKSPLEIERLVQAAAIHRTATEAVVAGYRPGMTEADVGKLFICSAYDNGAENVISGNIMCGAAKEGVYDTKHAFDGVDIGPRDYLEIDLAVCFHGYWADMARVLNVGEVDPAFAQLSQQAREAFETVVAETRPGMTVRELQELFYRAGGCDTPDEMAGHGIGLDVHEPPMVTLDSPAVLQAGMTFEIEPCLLRGRRVDGGPGLMHYENLVIITESGCTPVYTLDPSVLQVATPYATAGA
jgi:Xaa-Pro dipeptidase